MNRPATRKRLAADGWIPLAVFSGVLVAFSQTGGIYDGDEGLHLVAALAVKDGRMPYADFFYWHQPLYLFLAASWMTIFGESWRSIHVLSAALTAACAALIGTFRFGSLHTTAKPRWSSMVAAAFFALNVLVLKWGTIGHNYAMCLLLSVAAFRLTVVAASRTRLWFAFWTGLCAGAAMATSLLIVPLVPIALIWLLLNSSRETRRVKGLAFATGVAIPFLPLAWLAVEAPYQTYFGLIAHHLFYRVPIDGAAALHSEILWSWIKSPQALLLIVLSSLGLWGIARAPDVDRPALGQAILAASLVIGIAVFGATVHPPARPPYFVLAAPFLAMLASTGTHAAALHLQRARATGLIVFLVGLFGLSAGHSIWREGAWVSEWARVEGFAEAVNRVTPRDARFYTSYAFVYFAARRLPPPGLENGWASLMALPGDRFETLRVLPASAVVEQVRAGGFETTLLWRDDPRFAGAGLNQVYRAERDLDRYFVLRWGPVRSEELRTRSLSTPQ